MTKKEYADLLRKGLETFDRNRMQTDIVVCHLPRKSFEEIIGYLDEEPTRPHGEVEDYQEETPNGFRPRKYICSNCGAELKGSIRPHGEWLNSDIPESILSKCSVCGFNLGAYTHNFCPNCGADMRGDKNEK